MFVLDEYLNSEKVAEAELTLAIMVHPAGNFGELPRRSHTLGHIIENFSR